MISAITEFAYVPSGAGSFTITYSLALVGSSTTISSLQIVGNSDIQIGPETDTTLAGTYTARLTGLMDDSVSTSKDTDFILNVVSLTGSISDITYRI